MFLDFLSYIQELTQIIHSRKLIGARFYKDILNSTKNHSARDYQGHGTHTSSTAAGQSVPNATYYGLASGSARGGSPTSRLAMYKVCIPSGECLGSAILAAFDDAIADGVDLLSLSFGAALYVPDFKTDPIAIGAFHAVQKGITVVCAAGNNGPVAQTVANVAPWILTVGATTIDRDFQSDVVLGNNKVIKGESINFSELGNAPTIPLISGVAAKAKSVGEEDARNCYTNALDAEKIKGKIVLCQHSEINSLVDIYSKIFGVKESGGVGIIIISDDTRYVPYKSVFFPMTVISSKDAADVYAYMNSTKNPVAMILATKQVLHFKPAPVVAYFSSRGPSRRTKNLIKPDIAAPGVSILAAWMGNETSIETTPKGRDPPQFNIISGTSMSCPHVTGIAANIKARNPSWSPAAIRSAIMTTATQINNFNLPITTNTGDVATPYDIGAGEVSPTGGLKPGLVYDMDPVEYLLFLCYYGYKITTIKLISPQLPPGFFCPVNSSASMISNLNYPSIAISINSSTSPVTVKRTVTNVDAEEEAVYTVFVDRPAGVEVTVTPDELRFTADRKTMDYQVTFSSSSSVKGNVFGAITWTNMKYKVRIPFVVISE